MLKIQSSFSQLDEIYAEMRQRARILFDDAFLKLAIENQRMIQSIAESAADALKNFVSIIGPASEFYKLAMTIQEQNRELPPRIQRALIVFAEHGWYMDIWGFSFPFISEVRDALLSGDIELAENSLIRYYNDRIDMIEKTIIEKFKHRAKIITAAFAAHRRGDYILSIPVVLAQTDGICKEVVGQHLFIKKDHKPATASYVDQYTIDSLLTAILQPLAQSLPIDYNEKTRNKSGDFSQLNRHMVLHGESLDYGTESNSLKSISLLNYVVQALTMKSDVDNWI